MRFILATVLLMIATTSGYVLLPHGTTPLWIRLISVLSVTLCGVTGIHQLVISAIEDERMLREAREKHAQMAALAREEDE